MASDREYRWREFVLLIVLNVVTDSTSAPTFKIDNASAESCHGDPRKPNTSMKAVADVLSVTAQS